MRARARVTNSTPIPPLATDAFDKVSAACGLTPTTAINTAQSTHRFAEHTPISLVGFLQRGLNDPPFVAGALRECTWMFSLHTIVGQVSAFLWPNGPPAHVYGKYRTNHWGHPLHCLWTLIISCGMCVCVCCVWERNCTCIEFFKLLN